MVESKTKRRTKRKRKRNKPQKPSAEQIHRLKKAVKFRVAGKSWAEIAEVLQRQRSTVEKYTRHPLWDEFLAQEAENDTAKLEDRLFGKALEVTMDNLDDEEGTVSNVAARNAFQLRMHRDRMLARAAERAEDAQQAEDEESNGKGGGNLSVSLEMDLSAEEEMAE